jgi:DNA polymerase III subunit delta'
MWNNIAGQEKVKDKLISIYKSNKVSHAYLFYGIDGVGKDAMAIEFAKLLNCTDVKNGTGACDKCSNCKTISQLKSEIFNIICALPSGKSDTGEGDPIEKLSGTDFERYLEQLNLKSENHYYKINLPNANYIRIGSIRNLINKIYFSTSGKKTKVFLISDADKLRQEASNALLKVLEEPPKNSLIILTTSRLNSLPQTVAGRCHKIFFEPLKPSIIAKKIKERKEGNYSDNEIKLASSFSQGSYSKAVELLELGIEEMRDKTINFLISILKNDYASKILIIREISAKEDVTKLKYFLFYLNLWFNDLLILKNQSNSENKLANFDLTDRLNKFLNNYPNIDFFKITLELENTDKLLYQNINKLLILINLSFSLKKYIINEE